MLSDPVVTMTCDGFLTCRYEEEFGLTAIARGGYDDRDLRAESERAGWVWQQGKHICADCAAAQEEARDETE